MSPETKKYLAQIGRTGGQSTSAAKQAASRANGKLSGQRRSIRRAAAIARGKFVRK